LAVCGVDLRTGWLFDGRDARDVSSERPAKAPGWTIDGQTVRTADGGYLAGGLVPARRVEEAVMAQHPPTGREQLISEFLRTSREAVAAQRDVLLSYLGNAPLAPVVVPQPVPRQPVPVITSAPAPAEPEDTDVLGTVRSVIGERTGYPVDMIEPELDLEADLSVDSIKRTEIAGELLGRFGLAGSDVDDLVKLRTTSAIADWFAKNLGGEEPAVRDAPAWTSAPPRRFTMERVAIDGGVADPGVLAGRTLAVAGGTDELVAALAEQLAAHGATVAAGGEADGLIHLGAPEQTVPDLVPLFQTALSTGLRWLVAVTPCEHGAGLRGLFRTLDREYPDTTVRLVETDLAATPAELASLLVGELLATGSTPVVRTGNGIRETWAMTRTSLGSLGTTGAGPAGDGAAEAAALGLGRESVVLLVGGARGITARFAETLAAASGCRIELVGRTPLPVGAEHSRTAQAGDLAGLRSALAGLGHGSPAEIEREAHQILAQREVAATLEELRGRVRYHQADIRDHSAVQRVLKDVYAEHGRLDGLVCAAGVIEDKLFSDKAPDSFRRVYETKVDGTRTLLSAFPDGVELPGFLVLFGSIAAVLGNRGQSDYAAANDALESIGADWAARTGKRALTVHWGPWAPDTRHGGMVSPELGRSYAQRGIELIDPEEGTLSLLRELAWGDPALRSVVYTASGW
jgi:NAD(P)-dependent dehydrogenase (short-subunit alcohol dehydrogenase family)/acyl carrier protein